MTPQEYYIRYRIYVNSAEKADRNYPRRLIRNLRNLDHNLRLAPKFNWEGLTIKEKTFIPTNLKHVGPKYFDLIAHISGYFNCLALWETVMIPGTVQTINTFSLWGYEPDVNLAFHYITKIINSLNVMRDNLQEEYRQNRIKRSKLGYKPFGEGNSTTKASKYFYTSLDNICRVTRELLENTPREATGTQKIEKIYREIRMRKTLDYRAYNFKGPIGIRHAASIPGKFQNKRLILVNF